MTAFQPSREVNPIKVSGSAWRAQRHVPEEVAVAIVCNGTTVAVMMATPADLEDFGMGFVLSEGIVEDPGQVEWLKTIEHPKGIEVRLWICEDRAKALRERRRSMAGPTGCGLCGIESLDQAVRDLPRVDTDLEINAEALRTAMGPLRDLQHLNELTRSVHAAAMWHPEKGYLQVREDVGRHNALDKLIGAMAGTGEKAGVLLLTSRVSIELVQKAALARIPAIAAVSAPTEAAIRTAEATGITLIGIARDDGFEIFTEPRRVALAPLTTAPLL